MNGTEQKPKSNQDQQIKKELQHQRQDSASGTHGSKNYPSIRWTIPKPQYAVMIAVSARALFDLREPSHVFETKGAKAYEEYMVANENKPLPKGVAFSFVLAMHKVNLKLLKLNPKERCLFDTVLITNNPASVGVPFLNSINFYGLNIERACFTGGSSAAVGGYLEAYNTDLYLSTDAAETTLAINKGIAAATVFSDIDEVHISDTDTLRIAFDGDAVLFSDEAEVIAKKFGLQKFFENEAIKADVSLDHGPLKRFAMILGNIKKKFEGHECPIRIYLITARGASTSGLRVLKTLREWGIEVDEALFLAGAPKGPLLQKIKPHLFFDDSESNIESGLTHGVYTSAHVPYGISQVMKEGGTAQAEEEYPE